MPAVFVFSFLVWLWQVLGLAPWHSVMVVSFVLFYFSSLSLLGFISPLQESCLLSKTALSVQAPVSAKQSDGYSANPRSASLAACLCLQSRGSWDGFVPVPSVLPFCPARPACLYPVIPDRRLAVMPRQFLAFVSDP